MAEDDPHIRALLTIRLKRSGFAVLVAADGAEALHLWRTSAPPPPAVIVTDWAMPKVDGMELAREIRADFVSGGVPIILFTAFPASDEAAALQLHYQSKTTPWAETERLIVQLVGNRVPV